MATKVRRDIGEVALVVLLFYFVFDNLTLVLLCPRISIKIIVITDLVTHCVHDDVNSYDFVKLVYSEASQIMHSFEINV